jgi:hypothetical protein
MERLSSDMEQLQNQVEWRRDKVRDLQQRIQSKGDITSAANRTGYSK